MRAYSIYDEENKIEIGTLLYYEKKKVFIMELAEGLDEWTAPLLLTDYVKRGILTIPEEISLLWVRERIIPTGRQNIGAILNTHRMKEYDECRFLELSEGRCSQDSMCIHRIEKLPEYVSGRMQKNLTECFLSADNDLICFFADDVVKKVDLNRLAAYEKMAKVLRNEQLLRSCRVSTGGYAASFDDAIEIPACVLYEEGQTIPLRPADFLAFVKQSVVDTTGGCEVLECSRQNMAYLAAQHRLTPIRTEMKGNLYTRGDILRNTW